jgi:hypothetical protein
MSRGSGGERARSLEESDMKQTGHFYLGHAAAVGVAALITAPLAHAQGANVVAIDTDDIGGWCGALADLRQEYG